MRKILFFCLIIIFIPFFIVMFFDFDEKNVTKLKYASNTIIRVKREKSGNIEYLHLEDYIVGVLAGEMPIYFEKEAFKAQAVAARSYALKRIDYNKEEEYDVVDSIMNQVYLDDIYLKEAWKEEYANNINKLREIVNETENEYLEYDGEIAEALFFSTSNGYTENSSLVFNLNLPYLVSVKSAWDEKTSSAFRSTMTLKLEEFYNKLGIEYRENLNVEILKRSSTNRVISLSINGILFDGKTMYNKLSLRSTDFSIRQEKNNVIIDMVGYGHGVGMSQYGAEGMAEEGYSYIDILKYYYTGAEIKKMIN